MRSLRFASSAAAVLLLGASPSRPFSLAPVATHRHALMSRPKWTAAAAPSSRRTSSSLPLPLMSADEIDAEVAAVGEDSSEDPPLFESPLKGIRRDYAMRLPFYKSDVSDGLNAQCLAATLFLFFACLAPAVGFGALFGAATGGAIGTMEMVSSTAMCGFVYALTSAQPLTIIGSTGPVLAFVATLVQLADAMGLPFLPLYAWTGIWTSGILFLR